MEGKQKKNINCCRGQNSHRFKASVAAASPLIAHRRRPRQKKEIKLLALGGALAPIKENLSGLIEGSASPQTAAALQSPGKPAGRRGPAAPSRLLG